MTVKSFSISEAIRYGFDTTKKNFLFFVVILLMVLGASIIPSVASGFFEESEFAILGFIITLIGWGLQMVVSLGIIGIALRVHDKKKVEYKSLFDYFHLVIPYFFASIIYTLIVLVGFILLVVPGIIWLIKFRYYTYFIVDKNMGPIDALKASSKITEGIKWKLFLLGLSLGIINIAGLLFFFVGIFFTAPIGMMAEAYVFRKLQQAK